MTALYCGFLALILCGSGCRIRSQNDTSNLYDAVVDQQQFVDTYNLNRMVKTARIDGSSVIIETSTWPIRFEFLTPTLFKVRYANREHFLPEYTYSVIDQRPSSPSIDVSDQGTVLKLKTSKIRIDIHKADATFAVFTNDGVERIALTKLFSDAYSDPQRVTLGQAPQKRIALGAQFRMHEAEHFYGLGQKLRGQFDQSLSWRGRKRDMQSLGEHFGNRFDGADGGANGNVMIPFLVSNRGSGLFLDTVYQSYWEFDDPAEKHWYAKADCDQDWEAGLPKCARSELRFYVMVGPDMPSVLPQYAALTGRPLMPPRWLFGFLQSRYGYANWDEVDKAVTALRQDGFPLDGIFLDLQWFGGVPGVFGDSESSIDGHSNW